MTTEETTVNPGELLQRAGVAAQILEDEFGVSAVARLKDGVVTLEAWSDSKRTRIQLSGDNDARSLALACLASIGGGGNLGA